MEIAVVIVLITAAVGTVLWPLLRKDAGAPDPVDVAGSAASGEGFTMAEIEREVARYREALRAGTVCGKCAQANPPGSRFCAECGRALRAARTQPVAVTTP